MMRSAIFAYFGDQLTEASWTALLTPIVLLVIALAIPLGFPAGREWLRNVFTPPPTKTVEEAEESSKN